MQTQNLISATLLAVVVFTAVPATAQDAESQVYSAVKTCSGLNAYLRAYPDGRFKADAQQRIARECGAPSSRPAAPASSGGDACAQARADWSQIGATSDMSLLKAFMDTTPMGCGVQRAQAQARITGLETEHAAEVRRQTEAAEVRRQQAAGVEAAQLAERQSKAQFVGKWVGQCGMSSMLTYTVQGDAILQVSDFEGSYYGQLVSVSPPIIKFQDGEVDTIEGDRLHLARPSGTTCYFRKP